IDTVFGRAAVPVSSTPSRPKTGGAAFKAEGARPKAPRELAWSSKQAVARAKSHKSGSLSTPECQLGLHAFYRNLTTHPVQALSPKRLAHKEIREASGALSVQRKPRPHQLVSVVVTVGGS